MPPYSFFRPNGRPPLFLRGPAVAIAVVLLWSSCTSLAKTPTSDPADELNQASLICERHQGEVFDDDAMKQARYDPYGYQGDWKICEKIEKMRQAQKDHEAEEQRRHDLEFVKRVAGEKP